MKFETKIPKKNIIINNIKNKYYFSNLIKNKKKNY